MFYPRGEVVAARAAGKAGTAYTLSTLSGTRVDEVKAGATAARSGTSSTSSVAATSPPRRSSGRRRHGCSALVVTIDTAVAGLRERDFRNGTKALLTRKPFTMLPVRASVSVRPRWLVGFFRDGGLMNFPNVELADGPM